MKEYAKIAKRLTQILRWEEGQDKKLELATAASEFAIGAVLSQNNKPIAFISRTLSKTEEHYATNEKEMLALNSLRSYLYGSAKVKIYTDH